MKRCWIVWDAGVCKFMLSFLYKKAFKCIFLKRIMIVILGYLISVPSLKENKKKQCLLRRNISNPVPFTLRESKTFFKVVKNDRYINFRFMRKIKTNLWNNSLFSGFHFQVYFLQPSKAWSLARGTEMGVKVSYM